LKKVAIIAVAIFIGCMLTGIALGYITGLMLVKPYVVPVTIVGPDLKVEDAKFHYDPPTATWDWVKVEVKNYAGASRAGVIDVYIYDDDGDVIASGSRSTGSIPAGQRRKIKVTIGWQSGKTVCDAVSARIVVIQD